MLLKKENGVTLIALAVTIIVLIILAGITLGTLQNRDSIVEQAKDTGASAGKESIIEKIEADLYQEKSKTGQKPTKAEMKTLIENKGYNKGSLGDDSFVTKDGEYTINYSEIVGWEDKNNEYYAETVKDNYTDGNGDKATIPEGFKVSEKEGEKDISDGLVVIGPDGSEFVWVPVSNINDMAQCSTAGGDCNLQLEDGVLKCKTHNDNEDIVGKLYATSAGENFGTANTTYNVDNGLREPAYLTNSNYGDASSYNAIGLKLSNMQENYRNMAAKVAKYGGFYVGRYETSLSDARVDSVGTNGKAQSKQGVIPTSAENSATSSWYGLYKIQDKTYAEKNGSVESSMIWGSQYDAIINWVKNGNNETEKAKLTNTSLGNNSGGSVTTTGNNTYANDSINNIRDLGGNLREWTLEAYYTFFRVYRGGYCNLTGSPSCRSEYYPYSTDSSYGSRLTLYIK